jgi:hypothetical protein
VVKENIWNLVNSHKLAVLFSVGIILHNMSEICYINIAKIQGCERFPFMHANLETLGSFHTRRNGLRKSCGDVCVRYNNGIASSYKGSKTITRYVFFINILNNILFFIHTN